LKWRGLDAVFGNLKKIAGYKHFLEQKTPKISSPLNGLIIMQVCINSCLPATSKIVIGLDGWDSTPSFFYSYIYGVYFFLSMAPI
jgi:hypothetical protein